MHYGACCCSCHCCFASLWCFYIRGVRRSHGLNQSCIFCEDSAVFKQYSSVPHIRNNVFNLRSDLFLMK